MRNLPKLNEAAVSQQIVDFCRWQGWKPVRTPATRMRTQKGFMWIFEEGHPDYLFVHPLGRPFYAELKAERGRTKPERRAKQHAWAEQARHEGFLVYSAPDGCRQPFEHFKAWFEAEVIG